MIPACINRLSTLYTHSMHNIMRMLKGQNCQNRSTLPTMQAREW